ncbi:MAG: hypothetical protein LBT46_15530 [Planctomycetaceae bacterium]|nr:hypothetical protein [Planctomycetaceae bacterium]
MPNKIVTKKPVYRNRQTNACKGQDSGINRSQRKAGLHRQSAAAFV